MNEKIEALWPLWRVALNRLRERPDFGYGLVIELSWFERELGCAKDTAEFAFALMRLRERVESENGYYIETQTVRDDEHGTKCEVAQIPSAADHEQIGRGFESRMRSYASRAVELRVKTLANPKADLKQEERQIMEKSMEIAATRAVLLRREKSVIGAIKKHQPKLLEK